MVLHVAGAEMIFMLAGELVEEILRLFAQHVDQHVQATAVRHTQHHFARAALAGVTDHFAQHRDQRVAALKREAFRAREFRAEVFFQPLCRGQLFQETFFLFAAKSCAARHRLQTLLDPALLVGVGDVHVFSTDRAAVGLLQRGIKLAQLHGFLADGKRTYIEGFLKIGFRQVVIGRIKIGHGLPFPQSQWIEVGILVTTETEGVDKLQHLDLFRIGLGIAYRGIITRRVFRQTAEVVTDL